MPYVNAVSYVLHPGCDSRKHRKLGNQREVVSGPFGGEVDPGKPIPIGQNDEVSYPAQPSPDPNCPHGLAKLMFWSIIETLPDGSAKPSVLAAHETLPMVGNNKLNVTGWYRDLGDDSPGPPAIIDDSFSVALGDFFPDGEDFVEVLAPYSSLTPDANDGVVSTAIPKSTTMSIKITLPIYPLTTEPFDQWRVYGLGLDVKGDEITIVDGSVGVAIAFYESPPPPPPARCKILVPCGARIEGFVVGCTEGVTPPACDVEISPFGGAVCLSVDPEVIGGIEEIINQMGLRDIVELASKKDLAEVRDAISALPPEHQKVIQHMLRAIGRE